MEKSSGADRNSSAVMGVQDSVFIGSDIQNLNGKVGTLYPHSLPNYKPNLHFIGHSNEDRHSLASQDSGIPTLEISNPEPINCSGLTSKSNHVDSRFIFDQFLPGSSSKPPATLSLESENSMKKSSTFPRSGYDTVMLFSPNSRALNRSDDISVCSVSSLSTELSTTLSVSNEDILDYTVTSDSSAIVNLESDEAQFSDVTLNSQQDPCEHSPQRQAGPPDEEDNRFRKFGPLATFFTRSLFAKKSKDTRPLEKSEPGWKLFGKVPLRDGLNNDPKKIQKKMESIDELIARINRNTAAQLEQTERWERELGLAPLEARERESTELELLLQKWEQAREAPLSAVPAREAPQSPAPEDVVLCPEQEESFPEPEEGQPREREVPPPATDKGEEVRRPPPPQPRPPPLRSGPALLQVIPCPLLLDTCRSAWTSLR
ncbi:UNVERIFIED_CONTAM: hypothetical protein FKN15_029803 [Acipenser sinensis]